MSESEETARSVLCALGGFLEPQKYRGEPFSDWDLASVLIFFEYRRNVLLEGHENTVGELKSSGPERDRKAPGPI